MNVYEAIATRKSVRSFLPKDVPEDVLLRMLEAARLAPSASNRQEWRFLVVRDREKRVSLAEAAHKQEFIAEAPVVLVCCAETDNHVMACGQKCYPIDVAIAMDHLCLCATAEGMGTCWIGAFDEERIKLLLAIPPDTRVVGLLPLGFPRETSVQIKHRLPLNRIVKYELWS